MPILFVKILFYLQLKRSCLLFDLNLLKLQNNRFDLSDIKIIQKLKRKEKNRSVVILQKRYINAAKYTYDYNYTADICYSS